jgi:hypothetical protein
MQFLKKNYEKIVLGAVVVLALGIVAFLPIMVSQENKKLDDLESTAIPNRPKPLPPLDLNKLDAMVKRSQQGVTLNLSGNEPGQHKIFNPVRWQRKADGSIFPNPAGTEITKLEITRIAPLYEIYSLANVSVTPGIPTHYGIGIKHEAAATAAKQAVKITYASLNQTTNNFTILSAEGPEEDPTGVTIKLSDTGERVTLTKDKPYQRVEGYIADLLYRPENKPFLNRRKTDSGSVCFANECYKIVDIEESSVVLLQLSNQKTWIRELNPTTNSIPSAL